MARYTNALQTPGPAEYYAPTINHYMTNEGFDLVNYNGQPVWKKGVGLLVCPQYLSVQYQGNVIYLEAFIRYPILPGVYVGEMGLSGFFQWVAKDLLKNRVIALEQFIVSLWQAVQQPYSNQAHYNQPYNNQIYNNPYNSQPYNNQPYTNQPYSNQPYNKPS
jgi:hypothetical protein